MKTILNYVKYKDYKKKFKRQYNKIAKLADKHEYISAAIFFATLVILFFFPVVFLGKTLTTSTFCGGVTTSGPYEYSGYHPPILPVRDPGAFAWQDESLSEYVGQVIKNEYRIPLWNPNMGLGYPILAGFHIGVLSPLNYIPFLFSSQLAWDIFFLLRIFLAGFLTYAFARRIGLDKKPSAVTGAIFMFSGYTMNFLNMPHFSTEVLIPLLLLSYEYFLTRPDLKRLLLCIAAVALTILPGMPEATFFTLLIGSLWFIFSLLFLHKDYLRKVKTVILFIAINVTALLLTAIQLIPFLELLNLSANSHSGGAAGLHSVPLNTIAGTFFPFLFNPIHTWIALSYYIGFSSLILAVLGITSYRVLDKRNRGILIFFSAFAILGLAKVYGASFINWIGSLPISNLMIYPKYSGPVIIFSLAIMAGYGFAILTERNIRYINTKLLTLLGLILVLTLYTFRDKAPEFAVRITETDDFLVGLINRIHQGSGIKIPPQILESIIASPTMTYFGSMIALGIIIYLLFYIAVINAKFRRSYFSTIVLTFVIVELYIYSAPLLRPDRYDTFKKAPYISHLMEDKEIYRVYGYNTPGHNSMLYPNTSSVFGIQDVRFLMAMGEKRYFEFLENVIGASDWEMANIRFTGESTIPLDSKYFDLMNVKYFLAPVSISRSDIPNMILDKGIILLNKENVVMSQASLNDRPLSGLMLHAPTKIEFPYEVKDKYLSFEYGIASSGVEGSNGVRLIIKMETDKGRKEVFDKLVNPQNNEDFLSWQKIKINLDDYIGREVKFIFEVQDNGGNAFDHFFVGNFSTDEEGTVFDKEIVITKNENYLPRVFITHRALELFKPEDIFNKLKDSDFDIRKEIIIEKDLPDKILTGNDAPEIDNSKAVISSYSDQEVKINTIMENEGFLVLLDQYYPGWKVYVDGKEAEIYPTDYVFRSVYLDKGDHQVVFRYEPISYRIGKYITLLVIILLIAGYVKRDHVDDYIARKVYK